MTATTQRSPAQSQSPTIDDALAPMPSAGRSSLGRRMLHGLEVIRTGQHRNGEILSFRRDPEANYQYCRSPFASACVHDLLSYFDVDSVLFDEACLGLILDREVEFFTETVADIRRHIRSFLAWQEEPAGWWRFLGRKSSLDPDLATTTNASIALMDPADGPGSGRAARRQRAVERFRSAAGMYYTFLDPARGGYGSMDEAGRPVVGFDRVVNADCLRYLGWAGRQAQAETQVLAQLLLAEVARGDLAHGTALYPSALAFPFALARAWRQGHLPGLASLPADLLPQVLALQDEQGGFGGPVSTALGVMALVDLGGEEAALGRARLALVRQMKPGGGWSYEDIVVSGFGSPALSTAFGLAALARSSTVLGDDL